MFARKPQPTYPRLRGSSPERPGCSRPREPAALPGEPVTPTSYSSDAALARRAASGDRSAQQLLFLQLKAAVHATLYRAVGSNMHMEDLLQESFLAVFRALPSYRGEAKLTTWADRIAVRVAFHYLRRSASLRAGDRSTESVPALRLVSSAGDNAEHRQGVARLYEQLRRLKPEYQIAFALFELDGRSIEEVAEITGVSLVAAKSRISRARRKLWEAARRDDVLTSYLANEDGHRA
jgi:RNA polymerase sigma-70 factor (ECF subfamily)